MLAAALALLSFLPSAPLPEQGGAEIKDIQCKDSGQYIGGIDRTYSLSVGGPKERKWEYAFATTGGQGGDIKMAGAYEFADNLVLFTGTTDQKQAVRFGLNFGFPEGKVQFNAFLPESDKALRYQRKCFRHVKGEWQPAEEIVLTMPRTPPAGNRWEVPFQGERTRWDEAGKQTRTRIAVTATFLDGQLQKPLNERLPAFLIPVVVKQRLEAAFPDQRGGINTGGFLRGFNPTVAQPSP